MSNKTIYTTNALRGPYWIGTERYDAPLPCGWLSGDTLTDAGEHRRGTQTPLVGIIDLTNRTRYGFSSRGVPQYLFFPLDPAYTPMIVGSKASTSTNQIGIALFESWDTTKSKWPRAALQELLGPVGDSRIEQKALHLRICPPISRQTKHDLDLSLITSTNVPHEESWETSFNIDPDGCKDVDDILAWRKISDGCVEFAIAIADVSCWIAEGSELDVAARQKGQTVYEDGVAVAPMFPPQISESAASLKSDGVARPVLACIWTFHNGCLQSPDPVMRSFFVKTHTTYTYESVLKEPALCDTLCSYLTTITDQDVGGDPHRWIELAMITYNRVAAKRLQLIGQGLLRRHSGMTSTQGATLAEQTGCKELAFLGFAAGEYCSPREDEVRHVGLGEDVYCHATSPLRRYADLVNQRLLCRLGSQTISQDAYSDLATALNRRAKAVKAFERDWWCLQNLNPASLTTANGWVLGWKQADPGMIRLKVYVPNWKRTVRVSLFSEGENKDESEGVCVKSLQTGQIWTVRAGDSIQVTAYCNLRTAQWSERFVFQVLPVSHPISHNPDSDSNNHVE